MKVDLEAEFHKKMDKVMTRKARTGKESESQSILISGMSKISVPINTHFIRNILGVISYTGFSEKVRF